MPKMSRREKIEFNDINGSNLTHEVAKQKKHGNWGR